MFYLQVSLVSLWLVGRVGIQPPCYCCDSGCWLMFSLCPWFEKKIQSIKVLESVEQGRKPFHFFQPKVWEPETQLIPVADWAQTGKETTETTHKHGVLKALLPIVLVNASPLGCYHAFTSGPWVILADWCNKVCTLCSPLHLIWTFFQGHTNWTAQTAPDSKVHRPRLYSSKCSTKLALGF